MKKINYESLAEITVKTQKELDMIPLDFKGRIYIEFGTYYHPAFVKNRYYCRVVAWGNSSVVAWGNSSVEARENSSVEAWENSSVVAWENSSVAGSGNAQICDRLSGGRIEISGNARIVYMPKSIFDYCDFYGLKHNKKSGRFFKCVHKDGDKYYSDYDGGFEYHIGENAIPNGFDDDTEEDCGRGIHVSYLAWALNYGRDWNDLAILEVEADLDGIVLPDGAPGKVRCKKVKVLREVPLEECGAYGKILANRRVNHPSPKGNEFLSHS